MTYELAKKLKDAGFPHDGYCVHGTDDVVFYPSLSELIEACGEGVFVLKRINISLKGLPTIWKWIAGIGDGRGIKEGTTITRHEYDTPKECVANLWLAINENKP